jgi:hypothetical protein
LSFTVDFGSTQGDWGAVLLVFLEELVKAVDDVFEVLQCHEI